MMDKKYYQRVKSLIKEVYPKREQGFLLDMLNEAWNASREGDKKTYAFYISKLEILTR